VIETVREIEAAFRDVRPPAYTDVLEPGSLDDHENEIKALRGFSSWGSIPDDVIALWSSALNFLSARAFQFYLPAYMKWSLLNFRKNPSFTSDATIYALSPTAKSYERRASLYAVFTPAQVRAVVSFLRVMSASPDFADADAAGQALRSYWLTRLESGA